jgi:HD-like signal output (HDOD) protein
MVLAEDLRHSSGRFLLGKGVALDHRHLRVLKIWGVRSVEVEGSPEDLEPPHGDEISPAALEAAERWTAKRFPPDLLSHPFLNELFRICALRKAREMARQQDPERRKVSSPPEGGAVSEQGRTFPSFKRQIDLQALVDRETGLASLPDIFLEISRVISDPRSSAVHVADVISKDTSLSAKLLKIVNSAFYGFPSEIDTISRAVMIVGTRQLSTLALGASVIRVFRDIPADMVDMKSFWEHSITCGVGARMIGSYKNIPNTERLFVAGLLHDIGRIILYRSLPEVGREILIRARGAHRLVRTEEAEVLGYDHAEIGGMLLMKWKLPRVLEQAVRYHHAPLQSQYPSEASIVCLSDIVANALEIGSSGEDLVPPLTPEVWGEIGLEKGVLTEMIELIDRQVAEIIHLFFDGR